MRRFGGEWCALIFVLALAGCGREEFLYVEKSPPAGKLSLPDHVTATADLADLGGDDKGVDVIWVIDNSGSMMEAQNQVIANASTFIEAFTKTRLDWKMGLVSTSVGEEPYLGLKPGDEFTFRDATPTQRFMDAVARLGISGDSTEQPLASIRENLIRYPNFKRKGYALTFIMVTDEEEQSGVTGADCLAQIKRIVPGTSSMFGYGVFSASDLGCASSMWSYAGSPFEQFFSLLRKAKVFPLCGTDYGTALAELGKDIVRVVGKPMVRLDYVPRPNSIRVLHEGLELPGGLQQMGGFWIYDAGSNSVLFHNLDFAKGKSQQVTVHYEVFK